MPAGSRGSATPRPPRFPAARALTDAAARALFKLMAYKDEYEVARLYTDGDFLKRIADQFEGPYKLQFHLAPPLLAERDPATGHLQKRALRPVDADRVPRAGAARRAARHRRSTSSAAPRSAAPSAG